MKIGILTYPLNNNYGCYLQSYALLHFLQGKGFDVEYIYRRHNKPIWKRYLTYAIRKLSYSIISFKWDSPIYNYEWHYMMKKGSLLYPFFEHHIVPHTEPIYTTKKLKAVCDQYDVIVVGSDQVWRAEILNNIEDYFLGFNEKATKIAYAVSFGKENPGYTVKQIESCGQALSSFKAVSVRENIGLKLIEDYGWTCPRPKVVIDPTMLLKKEDYMAFLNEIPKKSFVFAYILDQTDMKKAILSQVAKSKKQEEYNILAGVTGIDFEYPSIEKWLLCYASASFVVTDSFHGAVFSIIFNIPFAVIINKERGAARFETLLESFDLNDRIVYYEEDVPKIINSTIEWRKVNAILDSKRIEATEFLLSNLEKR